MAEDFVSAFAKFIQEQGGTVVEVAAVEKSVSLVIILSLFSILFKLLINFT